MDISSRDRIGSETEEEKKGTSINKHVGIGSVEIFSHITFSSIKVKLFKPKFTTKKKLGCLIHQDDLKTKNSMRKAVGI